jgi:hypothetical protein
MAQWRMGAGGQRYTWRMGDGSGAVQRTGASGGSRAPAGWLVRAPVGCWRSGARRCGGGGGMVPDRSELGEWCTAEWG